MNERIKQLAEQAGSTHKQNLGVYQFYTDELEQLVLLIVKDVLGCYAAIDNGNTVEGTDDFVKAIAKRYDL